MQDYILIIFLFTLLFFLVRNMGKSRVKIEKIIILLLSILSGIRYSTGTDYFNYEKIYIDIKNGILRTDIEFGYYLLNLLVSTLELHYNVVLFICSFIYLFGINNIIDRYIGGKNKWISIFLWLSTFNFYFFSLSIVRQSVSIYIFMFSLKYIQKKKIIKFIFCIFLGAFFHKSIILLIPFYYFANLKKKETVFIFMPFFIFILSRKNFLIEILNKIYPKVSIYIELFNKTDTSYNSILLSIVYLIITYYFKKKNKCKQNDILYSGVYAFLIIRIMVGSGYGLIFYRMIQYFGIFIIILVPIILDNIYAKVIKTIGIISLVIFQIINFNRKYDEWNSLGKNYKETNEHYHILYIDTRIKK